MGHQLLLSSRVKTPKISFSLCVVIIAAATLWFSSPLMAETKLSEEDVAQAVDYIKKGIDQYKQSDFDRAISNLSKGLEILEKSLQAAKKTKELINAHLHLGLAYIGVNEPDKAKAQFKEILRKDSQFSLDENAYSTKVIALFNEAKVSYLNAKLQPSSTTAAAPDQGAKPRDSGEPTEVKKPFYKKWWFWTAAGVGAVAIAAAAGNNKSEDNTTNGTPPEPYFSDDFNDGDFDGWVVLGSDEYWSVQDGILLHSQDESSTETDAIITGSTTWEYKKLTFEMSNFQGDEEYEIYIFFGYIAGGTGYVLNFGWGDVFLARYDNWNTTWDSGGSFPLESGKTYEISIEVDSDQIAFYIDGNYMQGHGYTQEVKGQLAIEVKRSCQIGFDNFELWAPDSSAAKSLSLQKISFRTSKKLSHRAPVRLNSKE